MTYKYKTARDFHNEAKASVKALSIDTKKAFHKAFFVDKMNLGDARKAANINCSMVAAELLIQLHKIEHRPLTQDEIK